MAFCELAINSVPESGADAALHRGIQFKWKGERSWAGLSQQDLTNLTVAVAGYIGIKPAEAQKIGIIFADHQIENINGLPWVNIATCFSYSKKNRYTNCTVVINRSSEMLEYNLSHYEQRRQERAGMPQLIGVMQDQPEASLNLQCQFENAEEMITWLLAEELHHAHVKLTAGTVSNLGRWEANYLLYLREHDRKFFEPYSVDLLEVAASRVALRTLARFSSDHERQDYFRSLYTESLRHFCHVTPRAFRDAFVETGFKEPGLIRKIIFNLAG